MFKRGVDISEEDLKTHSVWFTFYEPDELELLEELGLDVDAFNRELEQVDNIDEYWYPLPDAAISMPFKYIYASSSVATPKGTKLVGYRTKVSLAVLYNGKRYYFNKSAADLCKTQEQELSSALNECDIFPMFVKSLQTIQMNSSRTKSAKNV
jgi:hypothetical protein